MSAPDRHWSLTVAEDLLQISLYRYGSRRTVFVTGELDVATAPALESAVVGVLDGQDGELCLDFSGLTFIDSTGIRAVMQVHNKVASFGSRMIILSPTAPVRRVLEITGFDRVMDVRDDVRG